MPFRIASGLFVYIAAMLSSIVAAALLGWTFFELGALQSLFLNSIFGVAAYGVSLLYLWAADRFAQISVFQVARHFYLWVIAVGVFQGVTSALYAPYRPNYEWLASFLNGELAHLFLPGLIVTATFVLATSFLENGVRHAQ
jgi:hypothetical protein